MTALEISTLPAITADSPTPQSQRALSRSALDPADLKICFLHIMKTAGMTLRPLIEQNFPRNTVGDPIHLLKAVKQNGLRAPEPIMRQTLSRYRYLRGHDNCSELLSDGFKWITVLREPVSRIKSLYRYWQRSQQDIKASPKARRRFALSNTLSLDELLALDDKHIHHAFHNFMCKVLVPTFPVRRYEQMSDEQLLESACGALDRMSCVGLTERFDDFMRLLCYTMGWVPPTVVQRLNVARNRNDSQSVPVATESVERAVRLDRVLYEHARGIFERQYARMVQDLFDLPAGNALPPEITDQEITNRIDARARAALVERSRGSRLPSTARIAMAEPIRGNGWLQREGLDVGRIYRWTGPGRFASLDLLITPAEQYIIELRIISVIHDEILRNVMVSVNGIAAESLAIIAEPDSTLLRGVVPGKAIGGDGFARIQIEVPKTAAHADVHADCRDVRQKGLAIESVQLHVPTIVSAMKSHAKSLSKRVRRRLGRAS